MTYYCSCYEFKVSMAGTAYAPLEIGGGIACPLCYWRGSQVVLRIPQGVAAMPAFWVLGLAM